jgi:hypothetical protein
MEFSFFSLVLYNVYPPNKFRTIGRRDWLINAYKLKPTQLPFSVLVQQHKTPVNENGLKTIKPPISPM